VGLVTPQDDPVDRLFRTSHLRNRLPQQIIHLIRPSILIVQLQGQGDHATAKVLSYASCFSSLTLRRSLLCPPQSSSSSFCVLDMPAVHLEDSYAIQWLPLLGYCTHSHVSPP
jgi:hypothetical protein